MPRLFYRRSLPWFLFNNGLLLAAGGFCLAQAGHVCWLAGAGAAALALCLRTEHYRRRHQALLHDGEADRPPGEDAQRQ